MAQSPRAACGASSKASMGHARPKSAKQMRSKSLESKTLAHFTSRCKTPVNGMCQRPHPKNARFFKNFNNHSNIQQASIATNLASVRREKNSWKHLFWLWPLLWTKSRALPIEEITWGACKKKSVPSKLFHLPPNPLRQGNKFRYITIPIRQGAKRTKDASHGPCSAWRRCS